MFPFVGGDQAGGHGHGRQQEDRLLQQEQETRRDTGKSNAVNIVMKHHNTIWLVKEEG